MKDGDIELYAGENGMLVFVTTQGHYTFNALDGAKLGLALLQAAVERGINIKGLDGLSVDHAKH